MFLRNRPDYFHYSQLETHTPAMTTIRVSGEDYKNVRVLGQGGFGTVYLVRDAVTNKLFALKDIACDIAASPASTAVESALEEIETLRSLSHPNIIKLIAGDKLINEEETHVLILMEYCSGGNLNDRLAQSDYDARKNLKWMRQIADALAYLHSCNTVHRDLKPENVLLTDQDNIKLADFGLARKYIALKQSNGAEHVNDAQYYMQTKACTLLYMAPEVFAGHYTEKSDVFSLGVLFYAIVERQFMSVGVETKMFGAFVSITEQRTGDGTKVGLGYAMANGYPDKMIKFTKASTNVQQLIENALSYDYHKRKSARHVKEQLNQL